MANWLNPLITTQYDVFLAEMKERDYDSVTMIAGSASNLPVGTVCWDRNLKHFAEWNGSIWIPIVVSISGGGTGASTPAGATGALGLGTMAFQNSNSVYITGGSIYDPAAIRTQCNVWPGYDITYDLGLPYLRWKNCFIAGGLVIPVGIDKYVVG